MTQNFRLAILLDKYLLSSPRGNEEFVYNSYIIIPSVDSTNVLVANLKSQIGQVIIIVTL